MIYRYLIGGICLASDIYFSEVMQTKVKPEAQLRYGDVPEHLQKTDVNFQYVDANENQYLLKIPNIGRFLVENGTTITVQPDDHVAPEYLNIYLLTSVFAALSYQRGFVPIHGGAFLQNGKGIILSGLSGTGKSTLLTMMHLRGYPVIADDICNIKIIDGRLLLYPAFPRIMLWKDTCSKLKIAHQEVVKMGPNSEKYFMTVNDSYYTQPVELAKIFVLSGDIKKGTELRIKGASKAMEFRANLFHPWMANVLGKTKNCLAEALAMATLANMELFENKHCNSMDETVNSLICKLGEFA